MALKDTTRYLRSAPQALLSNARPLSRLGSAPQRRHTNFFPGLRGLVGASAFDKRLKTLDICFRVWSASFRRSRWRREDFASGSYCAPGVEPEASHSASGLGLASPARRFLGAWSCNGSWVSLGGCCVGPRQGKPLGQGGLWSLCGWRQEAGIAVTTPAVPGWRAGAAAEPGAITGQRAGWSCLSVLLKLTETQ